jgi:hypothetical protein
MVQAINALPESPRKDTKIYALPLYLDKVSQVSSRIIAVFNYRTKQVINNMHLAEI